MAWYTFGKNASDTSTQGGDLTFDAFVKLARSVRRTGTLDAPAYAAAKKPIKQREKDGRWFITGRFVAGGRRVLADLQTCSGFTCDFDSGRVGRSDIEAIFGVSGPLSGTQFIAWTTHSHTAAVEKWRVVIPYDKEIPVGQHGAAYAYFNDIFDGDLDPSCEKPAQLWYLPSCPTDRSVDFLENSAGSRPFSPAGFAVPRLPVQPSAVLPPVAGGMPPIIAGRAKALAQLSDLTGHSKLSLQEIAGHLNALPKDEYAQYESWLKIGMALHDWDPDRGERVWDRWSRTLAGYDPAAISAKWPTFGGRNDGITVGTLIAAARRANPVLGVPPAQNANPSAQPAQPAQPVAQALLPAQPATVPVQLALPLIPTGWRNSPHALCIDKVIDEGNGPVWRLAFPGCHLLGVESRESLADLRGSIALTFGVAGGSTRRVRMAASCSSSQADFTEAVSGVNIFAKSPEQWKNLKDLVVDWLQDVQQKGKAKKTVPAMGWMFPQGKLLGFAAGTTAFYSDGREEPDSVDDASPVVEQYTPRGDIAPWQVVANHLTQTGAPELNAILATAFASPLMRVAGISGAVLSVVSKQSGVGKSSTARVAQAVWGSRDAIHSANDTQNAFANKMGTLNHLPVYWDDIKGGAQFEKLPELLFQITQGREKARSQQDGTVRPAKTWDTIATFTANHSLLELMDKYDDSGGSDAAIYRIFEIKHEDPPANALPDSFFDAVRTNYGWAGQIYSRWLACNYDVARKRVDSKRNRLSAFLKSRGEERFWITMMAVMIVGAEIAKELNILQFDVRALTRCLLEHFGNMRGIRKQVHQAHSAADVIADMMADMAADTFHVAQLTAPGRGAVQVVKHALPGRPPKGMYAQKEQVWRVRCSEFRSWMIQHGHSQEGVIRELVGLRAIRSRMVTNLGTGTIYGATGTNVRCHQIMVGKLGLLEEKDTDDQLASP